jgi:hypothetical protein
MDNYQEVGAGLGAGSPVSGTLSRHVSRLATIASRMERFRILPEALLPSVEQRVDVTVRSILRPVNDGSLQLIDHPTLEPPEVR